MTSCGERLAEGPAPFTAKMLGPRQHLRHGRNDESNDIPLSSSKPRIEPLPERVPSMFRKAWDQRLAQAREIASTCKREAEQVERQI